MTTKLERTVIAMLMTAACGRGSTLSDPLRDPHEGQLKLTIHNEVGSALCDLHVYMLGQRDEGANQLPPNTELASGRSHTMWLPHSDPHDTYQVSARGCTYEPRLVTGYAPSVILNGPVTVVVYDETDPRSKQAASEVAHANANTTLIAAKITRNPTPTARPAAHAPAEERRRR